MATSSNTFKLSESKVTLDTTPRNTILLHSTNCFGLWGAGIALAIHERYPAADQVYEAHCNSKRPDPSSWPARDRLIGTCLLIPPQIINEKPEHRGVWIACLFTSYGFGRPTKKKAGKDSKGKIVQQTRDALLDLKRQLDAIERGEMEVADNLQNNGEVLRQLRPKQGGRDNDQSPAEKPNMTICSPQFNAGAFGVKWEETESIVQEVFKGWQGKWTILAPPK